MFSSASRRAKGWLRLALRGLRRPATCTSVSYPHRLLVVSRTGRQTPRSNPTVVCCQTSPKSHLPAPHVDRLRPSCSVSARHGFLLAALRHLNSHPCCCIRPVLGDDEHVAECAENFAPTLGLPFQACPVEKGLDARRTSLSLHTHYSIDALLPHSTFRILTLTSPVLRRPRFTRKNLQREALRACNASHAYDPFSATPPFVL